MLGCKKKDAIATRAEVLKRLCEGDGFKEIAAHIGVTAECVKLHAKALVRYAKCRNLTALGVWAVKNGYLETGDKSRDKNSTIPN